MHFLTIHRKLKKRYIGHEKNIERTSCCRWRSWIFKCVSIPRFAILINGSPSGHFGSSRGLSQEDPLSPFLFLIVAESLTKMMAQTQSLGLITGFRLGRTDDSNNVAALQFVDYTLLMIQDSPSEVRPPEVSYILVWKPVRFTLK